MAHEVKYLYRAYMPIDGIRKIVHIEALTDVQYQFVSIEQHPNAMGSICLPVRYRGDIIVITTRNIDF